MRTSANVDALIPIMCTAWGTDVSDKIALLLLRMHLQLLYSNYAGGSFVEL